MNCKYHFFLHFFFLPLWIISQCNQTIKYENSIYVGCLNFEGVPHGEGRLDLNFDDQIQTQDGNFKDGEFFSGELLVDFLDGEKRIINYLNYPQELISDELYIWKNLDKKLTIYQNGYKSKEVKTYGPGDRSGLVETTYYEKGKNPIIIRNTDNNRNPDDIIGDKEYTDVTLIEKNNQYRINIVFPTKNGEEIQVPIQFDSGATSFFIGHNLYKELKKSADITDLNVKGISGGVGSEFDTRYIMIKKIKLADYQINNVVAVVPLREDINDMLIGVGFLKKFKEVLWSLNSNLMRFYK
ncbi:MAG: hypothetical protein CMM96_05140 [Rickettsiales bacterium]|nr:hypothetical protein [Rickettsiales bacterium]|tara:strand:+ start:618 stop:1508 length:891 start_codon:yes stop_codon:yes gene_type:complete